MESVFTSFEVHARKADTFMPILSFSHKAFSSVIPSGDYRGMPKWRGAEGVYRFSMPKTHIQSRSVNRSNVHMYGGAKQKSANTRGTSQEPQ